jgi:hypothetical protein
VHPVAAKFADRFTIAGALVAGVVGMLLPPHADRIGILSRLNAQNLEATSRSVIQLTRGVWFSQSTAARGQHSDSTLFCRPLLARVVKRSHVSAHHSHEDNQWPSI